MTNSSDSFVYLSVSWEFCGCAQKKNVLRHCELRFLIKKRALYSTKMEY